MTRFKGLCDSFVCVVLLFFAFDFLFVVLSVLNLLCFSITIASPDFRIDFRASATRERDGKITSTFRFAAGQQHISRFTLAWFS